MYSDTNKQKSSSSKPHTLQPASFSSKFHGAKTKTFASALCTPQSGTSSQTTQGETLTEELLEELLCSPDVKKFIDNNSFKSLSLSAYLSHLLEEKGLTRAEIIRKSDLNETHGYQIFTGQRGASRNKVLQIAFAMNLTLHETNRALQAAGTNQLYCKTKRDAIIIFCLTHNQSLQKTNEQLFAFREDTIC